MKFAFLVLMAAAFTACGGSGGRETPQSDPKLRSFTASPSTINKGMASSLQWEADEGFSSLVITPTVGSVTERIGLKNVRPTHETTYTITATYPKGEQQLSATVGVWGLANSAAGDADAIPMAKPQAENE